jgi:hypothetical protein
MNSVSDICTFVGGRSVPNSTSVGNALATILPPEPNNPSNDCIFVMGRCSDSAVYHMVRVSVSLPSDPL